MDNELKIVYGPAPDVESLNGDSDEPDELVQER